MTEKENNRVVLSVDFELFSQTPAYRSAAGSTDEENIGLAAAKYLRHVLDTHDATATFFVVSAVAEAHPDVVRKFAKTGNEIGSHSHSHSLLTDLNADARREELEHSREILREITGQPIEGFRAPVFTFPNDHFERLDTAGYTYDSSVVPSRWIPGLYGGEYTVNRPVPATRIQPTSPANLTELPVSVMPHLRLPLTGAWLRIFGRRYTLMGMRLLARQGITPVLYIHPWELVDLPPVDGVPKRVYWRTGRWMRRALHDILASPFEFIPAKMALENVSFECNDTTTTDDGDSVTKQLETG